MDEPLILIKCVDETHCMKHVDTNQRGWAVAALGATLRWGFTGTPAYTTIDDILGLLYFLFGDREDWKTRQDLNCESEIYCNWKARVMPKLRMDRDLIQPNTESAPKNWHDSCPDIATSLDDPEPDPAKHEEFRRHGKWCEHWPASLEVNRQRGQSCNAAHHMRYDIKTRSDGSRRKDRYVKAVGVQAKDCTHETGAT